MLVALGVAGVTLAAPSFGAEPQVMAVSNLDAGDHLNVRAEPTVRSADLGDLSFGELVEVVEYTEDGKWARFIWAEGNGWASARFLANTPREVLRNGLPVGLACSGTEPFWSAKIGQGGAFEFTPSEGSAVMSASTSAKVGGGYDVMAGEIMARLSPKSCTDGATDRDYGWQLDLTLASGYELTGCCQAAAAMR